MERLYRFFDMEDVVFDDEKTVRELVKYVFDESMYYEPMGMENVTVYDSGRHRVVLDTSRKCKDELTSPDDSLFCIAYLKKGKFFYAEGGWGHHMIQMDACAHVPNPVNVKIIFEDFKNSVVLNGNLTLGEIYSFLCSTTYISPLENKFYVCELSEISAFFSGDVKNPYLMDTSDRELTVKQVTEKLAEPLLMIRE